jgi:hypothetical protein
VVAALIDDGAVEVVDIMTGVDRANLHLVLAALAHAAGSHEHADLTTDAGGVSHLTCPGPVVAWPT